MSLPRPHLAHLAHLTDDTGLFEHALGSVPRRAHGWCTDDNGRALALVCRSEELEAERLAGTYLAFLLHAHAGDGTFRLRMAYDRHWTQDPSSDDANARAVLGLAVAAVHGPEPLRWAAAELFADASGFRSPHPRATARAAIAAAEVASLDAQDEAARLVLTDACGTLPRPTGDATWPWPAGRLTYENAIIPEALIATGNALGDAALVDDGLRLLTWLVHEETRGERFSFTPVGGRGPGEPRPAFDQQPIEAAAMAEACARAFDVTGDPAWLQPLERAATWVCGRNDAGTALIDPITGAGFDGLQKDGVNRNQGGESTIVVLSVLQLAHRLLPVERLESLGVAAALSTQREAASAPSS